MPYKAVLALVLLLIAIARQTVQQTRSSQFIVVSESQEIQLGEDAYKETLNESRLWTRSDWQTQLRRVGQRIAAVADKPAYKWEFNVIQAKRSTTSPCPVAKSFSGRIMPVAQDDNGIAVIMGHEWPMRWHVTAWSA